MNRSVSSSPSIGKTLDVVTKGRKSLKARQNPSSKSLTKGLDALTEVGVPRRDLVALYGIIDAMHGQISIEYSWEMRQDAFAILDRALGIRGLKAK